MRIWSLLSGIDKRNAIKILAVKSRHKLLIRRSTAIELQVRKGNLKIEKQEQKIQIVWCDQVS